MSKNSDYLVAFGLITLIVITEPLALGSGDPQDVNCESLVSEIRELMDSNLEENLTSSDAPLYCQTEEFIECKEYSELINDIGSFIPSNEFQNLCLFQRKPRP